MCFLLGEADPWPICDEIQQPAAVLRITIPGRESLASRRTYWIDGNECIPHPHILLLWEFCQKFRTKPGIFILITPNWPKQTWVSKLPAEKTIKLPDTTPWCKKHQESSHTRTFSLLHLHAWQFTRAVGKMVWWVQTTGYWCTPFISTPNSQFSYSPVRGETLGRYLIGFWKAIVPPYRQFTRLKTIHWLIFIFPSWSVVSKKNAQKPAG